MSLKKQYLKSRPACKVTFRVTKAESNAAKTISLVGDFNDWDSTATPMNALKNGDFSAVVELNTEKPEYQFRYLFDGSSWENDPQADGFVNNGIDGENSVIRV